MATTEKIVFNVKEETNNIIQEKLESINIDGISSNASSAKSKSDENANKIEQINSSINEVNKLIEQINSNLEDLSTDVNNIPAITSIPDGQITTAISASTPTISNGYANHDNVLELVQGIKNSKVSISPISNTKIDTAFAGTNTSGSDGTYLDNAGMVRLVQRCAGDDFTIAYGNIDSSDFGSRFSNISQGSKGYGAGNIFINNYNDLPVVTGNFWRFYPQGTSGNPTLSSLTKNVFYELGVFNTENSEVKKRFIPWHGILGTYTGPYSDDSNYYSNSTYTILCSVYGYTKPSKVNWNNNPEVMIASVETLSNKSVTRVASNGEAGFFVFGSF